MAATAIPGDELKERMSEDTMKGRNNDDHSEASGHLLLEELKMTTYQDELSLLQLLILTCPALGIQIMWLLMMSYGTPYLKSLGLSDSLIALVWLAGPLSGTIVQSIFGVLSDRCRNPWGKRKPFIVGGVVCVIFCLLFLACAPDLVHFVATPDGRKVHDCWVSVFIQACSVISVYGLNIAMQPLQSGTRALIIDTCPASQQARASGRCSRFSGIGSVFIYLLGFTAIPTWAPLLASTEFKALSMIGTLALIITVATCLGIRETPLSVKDYQIDRVTARSILRGLSRSLRTLPPTTWKVCKIQFFAWLAWFPVLYYSSTYIYQTYMISEQVHLNSSDMSTSSQKLIGIAKRKGIIACFCFAIIALATNLLLPLFVRQVSSQSSKANYRAFAPTTTVLGLPLSQLWQFSHILSALCMFLTVFAHSVSAATVLVGVVGMSWGVATWAPYALISTEISYIKEQRSHESYPSLSSFNDDEEWREEQHDGRAAIMGIHNIAIAIPQIIAALSCAAVFKVRELVCVDDGAAWVFRVAGCAALMAAWMTTDLQR